MARERAGPQGGKRSGFEEAVRQAYKNEHGATTLTAIAALIGIGKSALSQRFSGPKNFKRETVDDFLRPIESDALRKSILEAYERDSFAPAAAGRDMPVLERVARLAHENRPDLALRLATEALDSGPDESERWTLSLLALKMSFRMDVPSDQMRIATRLKEWGEASGRPELVAAALAVSARALRRTAMFEHEEATDQQIRSKVSLPDPSGLGPERLAVWRFADDLVRSEMVAEALRSHETRGDREPYLRNELANIARRRRERALGGPGLARAHQLEASIRLALGELKEAGEAIEASIAAAGGGLVARLEVGAIQGRLLAAEGKTERAEALLRRMVELCERDRYTYLGRLAQKELTAIEKGRL